MIAKVNQLLFDRIWYDNKRFISLQGPDVSGHELEIRAPGYNRYMTGMATEYEDGFVTIEIFTKVNK